MPLYPTPGAGTGDMLASNNLSEVASQSAAQTNLGLAKAAGSGAAILATPAGFDWSHGWTVSRGPDGRYDISARARDYFPDAPTTFLYVSAVGGSDANAGTSWSAAFATISAAFSSAAYTGTTATGAVIYIRGYFEGLGGMNSNTFVRDTAIIGVDGMARLSVSRKGDFFSWTQQSAPNANVWATASFNASAAFDRAVQTAERLYTPYTRVTSVVACQALPGSVYNNGTTTYVHTLRSNQPDANVVVSVVDTRAGLSDLNHALYVENVSFECGLNAFTLTQVAGSRVAFKDCRFAYAAENGFEANRAATFIMENCTAVMNGRDGFNYDWDAKVLELNCRALFNGWDRVSTNTNGSTTHHDVRAIRIGGNYSKNWDRNIHDVHNSQSWNLGCIAANALVDSSDTYANANWVIGLPTEDVSGEAAQMWLDGCITSGSAGDYVAMRTSTLYLGRQLAGVEAGTGTISDYTP